MEVLQKRGYKVIEPVTLVGDTLSCTAFHPGCPNCLGQVSIKVRKFMSAVAYAKSKREIESMEQLRNHPSIVRLNEHFEVLQSDGSVQLFLVIEWLPRTLMKEITNRKSSNYFCPEELIFSIALNLISVLACAERLQICHRNITPLNIYVEQGLSTVKLGNFEASSGEFMSGHWQEASVLGTFEYASTEMREALICKQLTVQHDVVKSDVFSLGITLLTLAKLELPLSLVSNRSAEIIWFEINNMLYGERLKLLLWEMMNPAVEQRLSFVMLEQKYAAPTQAYEQSANSEYWMEGFQGGYQPEQYQNTSFDAFQNLSTLSTCPTLSQGSLASTEPASISSEYQSYWISPQELAPISVAHEEASSKQLSQIETAKLDHLQKELFSTCCPVCEADFMSEGTSTFTITCRKCRNVNFCSRDHFIAYVEQATGGYCNENVSCPICFEFLSHEVIIAGFGGVESMESEIKKHAQKGVLCETCKLNAAEYFLDCKHIHCLACMRTIQTVYASRCSKCDVTSKNFTKIQDQSFLWTILARFVPNR